LTFVSSDDIFIVEALSGMEFIDLPKIDRLVSSGQLTDEQIRSVQNDITKGLGDVVPGTGGFKKIRCLGEDSGKRGGWRIYFAEYPKLNVVVLVTAFPKNKKEDLTQEEKNSFRKGKRVLDREVKAYVSKD
jgi:hypothetical protein